MDLAWRHPGTLRLEVGEPDFPTPEHIVEAAVRALRDGHTRYSPNAGIPELREALTEKLRDVNGLVAHPDELMVTPGAIEGLFAVMRLLLDPGDEILIPDPAWPNFAMIAHLIGAKPVPYALSGETDYLPEPTAIEELITPRTRAILLNSPSNPLGTVVDAPRLRDVLAVAERHGLWTISDECYDELFHGDPSPSSAPLGDPASIISIYSFSKTHAMTGWRVGYVHAPRSVIGDLLKIQEPIVSCVNTPAQHAAIAALTGPKEPVLRMREAYRRRRDVVCAELERGGIPHVRPDGAFYLWLECVPPETTSIEFCQSLVRDHGVAIAPGIAFGKAGDGACRISLAASEEHLVEGTRRVVGALEGRHP